MSTPFIIKLKEVICDKYERFISLKFRSEVESLLHERIREHAANVIQYVYREYKNRILYKNIMESLQERLNNECAYRIQRVFKNYVKQNKKPNEQKCDNKREEMRVYHRSHDRNQYRQKSDEMSLDKILSHELSRLSFGITNK